MIRGLIASVLRAALRLAEDEEPGCRHPDELRRDISTMGHPRWMCGVTGCSYVFDPNAPKE